MQPIDYSKWDQIDCSSDESVDENDDDKDHYLDGNYEYANENTRESSVSETAKRHPSVTKLEFPSKVIIGPDGVHMERMPETATSSPFRITHGETHHNQRVNSAEHKELLAKEHTVLPEQLQNEELEEEQYEWEYRSEMEEEAKLKESQETLRKETQETQVTENTETDKIKSAAQQPDGESEKCNDVIGNSIENETDAEDDVLYCNLIKNGGREGDSHLWSQTADTVTVSFIVPLSTRSKNVNGFRITDNYSAETYQTKSMINFVLETREADNGKIVITSYHNTFRYPVKLDEDLIDGCWQLQTIPSRQLRLLVVQVFKREVGVGMTLWWNKCFEEDTHSIIDPCQIEERKCRGSNSSTSTFYETWQKAHAEFKKRMKERKSNDIEVEQQLKS